MAIDFPNSPSVDDTIAVGADGDIRFFRYAGSSIWRKLNSFTFIYDGKAPADLRTATLDGGQA